MIRPESTSFGLLAGGRSSRMGADKASLIWRGQPLWQHQLRLAAEIGAKEILISGNPGGPYRHAARVIPDEISDAGPLAGLASLLNTMQSEWLLVVAVDMPWLDTSVLGSLLKECDVGQGVVPWVEGRIEALAAVYPRAARKLAGECLVSENRSMHEFVRRTERQKLVKLLAQPASSSLFFRSVNTASEWSAAVAEQSGL